MMTQTTEVDERLEGVFSKDILEQYGALTSQMFGLAVDDAEPVHAISCLIDLFSLSLTTAIVCGTPRGAAVKRMEQAIEDLRDMTAKLNANPTRLSVFPMRKRPPAQFA